MGSLVSERQLDTLTRHVEDAVSNGVTVLAGGQARPDVGPLFYEPTILSDVHDGVIACADETFGPVVSLYRVETRTEAIDRANDSRYGLNFSVWTSNPKHGRQSPPACKRAPSMSTMPTPPPGLRSTHQWVA